jgi:uncharacterized protein (TIGR03067 family)
MAVIAKAQIYEVDDAFYKKLSKSKRLSKEDLEKLEREVLDPPLLPPEDKTLFKLLDKQKLILAGKGVKVNNGLEADLLSWKKTVQCLPSPYQVRKGDKYAQTVVEGVSLAGIMNISPDRRFVRVKFVEKNVELEAVEKVKVLDNEGTEVVAEVPLLKEGKHSQVRDIPDGGSFLLPLSYRPDSARKQDRWWIICITPRIYIEEEEALVRKESTKAILGKWKMVTAQRGGKPLPEDNFFRKAPTTFLDGFVTIGVTKYRYRLDPTKKPNTIDLELFTESRVPIVDLGIYSLEGENLRICWAREQRPTDFTSPEGSDRVLLVLKR